MSRRLGVLLAAAMFSAGPAWAHHSSAMFDSSRTITLAGTVKELQWTSPHCWIQLMSPDAAGVVAEWSIEMAAPFELMRRGWKLSTLKPGDKVTIVAYPARDGSKGAMFVSAAGVDGRPIGAAK